MSISDFYHLKSGCYPCELDDTNLSSLHTILEGITPAFEGKTNFSLQFYLQQIANATSMDIVKGIVAPFWTNLDEPMTNLHQLLLALNLLIKTFDGKHEDIFHLELKGQAVHVYIRTLQPVSEEFESESLAGEISAASEHDLTKELRLAEEQFNSEDLTLDVKKRTTDANPWKTPAKTVPIPTISVTKKISVTNFPTGRTRKDMPSDENTFSILQYADDEGDQGNPQVEIANSAIMQQSFDSTAFVDDSPIVLKTKKGERLSQMEKLANRDDRNLRKAGWATISRHLERGDPDSVGIEDLCFYICHASKNLRSNKREHVNDFNTNLTNQRKKAEQNFRTKCDNISNESSLSLAKEDEAIFNKIRINRNSLNEGIDTAKAQINRLVELSRITNTVVEDIDARIEFLCNQTKKSEDAYTQRTENSSVDVQALLERIEKQDERIIALEATSNKPECNASEAAPVMDETSQKSNMPDNVESSSKMFSGLVTPKHQDSMLNILAHSPYQCMSRVQIRHPLLRSVTGWLLSYTVHNGTYFYHISTMGGTDLFAYHSDIVEVKEAGEQNNFLYGYNPTRNMEIFNTTAALQHVPTDIQNSPLRTSMISPNAQHPASIGKLQLPTGTASPSRRLPPRLFNADESQEDDIDSQTADDDRSVKNHRYHQRPLLSNEFSYPIGTAVTKIREDKIEALHKTIKAVLSDTASIRLFYDELRRRLKAQNVPLREWNQLAPGIDILDIVPKQCVNYQQVRPVMSRAIFNLLDANKDTLVTCLFMRGELSMYDENSDGFGFLAYMVSQNHPKFRHKVVQPSISASLKIPTFDDNLTLHVFCSNVKDYLENGLAPEHFTPFAAVQYVLEALRTDTRFATGCAYLQTEVNLHNNKTGYAPPHLRLSHLPRTILDRYEPAIKSELSKPRRMGLPNARRVEFDHSDDELVVNAFTRSQSREGGYKDRTNTRSNFNGGRGNGNRTNSGRGRSGGRGNYNKRNSDAPPGDGKDIPFKQCPCCGKAGHDECDCRQKGSFVKLSQWYELLSKSQRQEIIADMTKNARATHERYKEAYGKRNAVRKRLNRVETDAGVYDDIDIDVEKDIVLKACRAHMPDLDFGSLDPNLDDDTEPYLDFDPDTDSTEYESRN